MCSFAEHLSSATICLSAQRSKSMKVPHCNPDFAPSAAKGNRHRLKQPNTPKPPRITLYAFGTGSFRTSPRTLFPIAQISLKTAKRAFRYLSCHSYFWQRPQRNIHIHPHYSGWAFVTSGSATPIMNPKIPADIKSSPFQKRICHETSNSHHTLSISPTL